jgi:hypothetical protein
MPDGGAPASPDDVTAASAPPEADSEAADQAADEAAGKPYGGDEPYSDEAYAADDAYADDEWYPWDYEQQPLSKLAVVALVTGLLALVPLGLGFGIAALAVIRKTGRRGYRMAVAGIYAAWIWVLIAGAVAILAYFTHGFHARVQVQYRPSAAYSLQPGDCLNGDPNAGSFTVVACSSAHEGEVYGRFSLTGTTAYPGAAAVRQQVVPGCATRLTAYVNPQLASIGFGQEYVYPDQSAWAAGERTVICAARFDAGALSGSIRKTS